jgi:hypothetical protein
LSLRAPQVFGLIGNFRLQETELKQLTPMLLTNQIQTFFFYALWTQPVPNS